MFFCPKKISDCQKVLFIVCWHVCVNFNVIILVFTDKYVNLRMIASCLVAGDGKRQLATCV